MSFFKRLSSILRDNPIDMVDEWVGWYSYGSGYSVLQGKQVRFMAKIEVDDKDLRGSVSSFTGSILEDENGIPEVTRIKGFLKDKKILFNKKYKRTYVVDNSGTRSIQSEDPYYVIYSGKYDKLTKGFTGQWKIDDPSKNFWGSGVWAMKRAHLDKDKT